MEGLGLEERLIYWGTQEEVLKTASVKLHEFELACAEDQLDSVKDPLLIFKEAEFHFFQICIIT